jgi:hypothetical protein
VVEPAFEVASCLSDAHVVGDHFAELTWVGDQPAV